MVWVCFGADLTLKLKRLTHTLLPSQRQWAALTLTCSWTRRLLCTCHQHRWEDTGFLCSRIDNFRELDFWNGNFLRLYYQMFINIYLLFWLFKLFAITMLTLFKAITYCVHFFVDTVDFQRYPLTHTLYWMTLCASALTLCHQGVLDIWTSSKSRVSHGPSLWQ